MKKKFSFIYLSLLVATLFTATSCWDGSEDDAYSKKVAGTWILYYATANDVTPVMSTQTDETVLFIYGNGKYETYSYDNYDYSSYFNKTEELLDKKGWNVRTTGHWTLENKEIGFSEENSYTLNDDGEEVCNKSELIRKANVTFDKNEMILVYTYNSSTEGTKYAEENIHTYEFYFKYEIPDNGVF